MPTNLGAKINWWGLATVLLTATGIVVEAVCLERGPGMQPRIYAITCYQVGLVFGLAGLACAVVATRRREFWDRKTLLPYVASAFRRT